MLSRLGAFVGNWFTGSRTSETDVRLISPDDKFDKSKRNALTWACALIVLMVAHDGEPLSATMVGGGSLSLAPLALGCLLASALIYHFAGFWNATLSVAVLHSEILKNSDGDERARLQREIDTITALASERLQTGLAAVEGARKCRQSAELLAKNAQSSQGQILHFYKQIERLKVSTSMLLAGPLSPEHDAQRFEEMHKLLKELQKVTRAAETLKVTLDTRYIAQNLDEMLGSFESMETSGSVLAQKADRALIEIRHLDSRIARWNRRYFALFEVGITNLICLTAIGLLAAYAITNEPVSRHLPSALAPHAPPSPVSPPLTRAPAGI